ncbi:hypothetical protein QJS10_CPA06g02370 [Acorus calamus]|uniref:DUF829 domain-containing protein n=1 Tax=Acorus calamus TaxID=4465 RepID=A0AAV9EJ31_ACOCL|nr:hypothetical protein QJS10_CPA06g02370 [Acorus calamus]
MFGDRSRVYWGWKEGGEEGKGAAEGIVVVFAWISSQDKNVRPYVKLYASLGWSTLVCHSEFLNQFFPGKAAAIAIGVINELIKEVKTKPTPIVLASFSGGPKACMYKLLQILDGKCEGQQYLDDYKLVRDCICGQIYDSSPVDFTSEIGNRFAMNPAVIKMSQPPRVLTWMAKAFSFGLNVFFLDNFEAQRADYWQTLYSSVSMGPILILCSENDDLAPYQIVCNFAQRCQELSGDVRLVKWATTPHVGHYKLYPDEYKAAVTELLSKALATYSQRMQPPSGGGSGMGGTPDDISASICSLHTAAITSNESLRRVALGPSDHFFLPSSVEYHTTNESGAVQNEQKGGLFHLQDLPSLSAHGVLGKILFDVCVPKNIEEWDIKNAGPLNKQQRFSSQRLNPIKCIRRSRL